jgi:hypothetical protein
VIERLVRKLLGDPEVIGDPECPLLYRWTLLGEEHKAGNARDVSGTPRPEVKRKLFLHYFLPNSADRDPHDHPRSFHTLVLRGYYRDFHTDERGNAVTDLMTVGTVRYRGALHTHMTRTGPKGCWTLVLMGPLERPWGFWRDGEWWPWKRYHDSFGHGMRCPD